MKWNKTQAYIPKMLQNGYTLIEIMIALVIFAILAVITSTAMYQAFNTRARLNIQADMLSKMQLALTLMSRDFEQVAQRPIRANDLQALPAFIGQKGYVEFTRGGIVNPQALEQRSTLKRIAYLCENNHLIRRSWESLDTPNRNNFEDIELINSIKECSFAFLTKNKQVLDEWQANALQHDQKNDFFPIAIRIHLTIEGWGDMSTLFIIPEALYA